MSHDTNDSLLRIEDLHVRFDTVKGTFHVLRGVNIRMGKEKIGIVGESGSGKSMTARAILSLVRHPGTVRARRLEFQGMDLLSLSQRQTRALRGGKISMIMQDPKFSLNPVMTVGNQIAEAHQAHIKSSKKASRQKAMEMLERVKIRDPGRVFHAFPHELSGGMGQRVMIAMMLIAGPDLLIADEPTSALDVTIQTRVLRIMDEMVTEQGMGLIFISHDLNLVRSFCNRVLIMYAGKIVEECLASKLRQARHPYTQGLLACMPHLRSRGQPLTTLTRAPSWSEAGTDD